MKLQLLILVYFQTIILCANSVAINKRGSNSKDENDRWNRDYVRRKRYLGLSKKFKLNRRFQECVGPGDVKGHCKHPLFCQINVSNSFANALDNLCVIEKRFVGICCPDDIALSGMVGSLLIMDLPAGGDDYDDNNTTGCGLPMIGTSPSTINSSKMTNWPWIAALYITDNFEKGLEQQFCGGALITDMHVLTATHCTRGLKPEEIKVRLGEYNFQTFNETRFRDYAVAQIIEHQEFDLATYANDIAIVKLSQSTMFSTYIWPICLPSSGDDFENKTAVVAGWGQTYFGGPASEVLLQIEIPIWPLQKCIDSFIQRITDHNICAAAYEGGKDSCKGDSGGPLMYQLLNGRWITIGIVSWGIDCGQKDKPGIYTKVSRYVPWIIKNTIAKK